MLLIFNSTASPIVIDDLGITIAASATRDIADVDEDSLQKSSGIINGLTSGDLKLIKDNYTFPVVYYTAAEAVLIIQDIFPQSITTLDEFNSAASSLSTKRSLLGLGTNDSPVFTNITATSGLTVNGQSFALSSPVSGQTIRYNGTNFINSALSLDDLSDVINTAPVTGDLVRYNGTNFVNTTLAAAGIQPLDADLTAIATLTQTSGNVIRSNGTAWLSSALSLDDLSDVINTTPVLGQTIRYNGTNFINSALSLDDLSDVIITSVAQAQIISYNGTNWVNVVNPAGGSGTIKQIISGTIPAASGSTTLLVSATPINTTGTQIWSQAITTTAGSSRVEVNVSTLTDCLNGQRYLSLIILRDTTIIGVTASPISNGQINSTGVTIVDTLPTTNAATYTYSVRVAISGSTWYVGQSAAGSNYGGLATSRYYLREMI